MFQVVSYFSAEYLVVFLPAVILLMAVLPQRARRAALLICNGALFWAFSSKLIVYLIFTTFSMHHIGLWISAIQHEEDAQLKTAEKSEKKELKKLWKKKQLHVLIFAVILHIGTLLVLKYSPFFLTNVNSLLRACGSSFRFRIPTFMIPMGISFYTMQSVSYMIDVYRRTIQADRNIFRLALYISFFPQIMEGPISRYSEIANQIWEMPRVKYENFIFGVQRITYGVLKKMVIADRLNMFLDNIYNGYLIHNGTVMAVGAVAYTIQLYMEFSGTMDLVIGCAQILGVRLPENFQRPFFSNSISEFWKRWHITLGTWFRDYIFYPVSMSKPMKKLTLKARKKLGNHFGPLLAGAIALFCVWFSNGLWHGAGWRYIFFGMYHFVLILLGNMITPYSIAFLKKVHINRNGKPYMSFRILRTTILVCIGEMFFRALSLKAGLLMFRKMVTKFSWKTFTDGTLLHLGMDGYDYIIIGVTLVLVFIVSCMQEKKINIYENVAKRHVVVRYAIYYAVILFIIIFGAYGRGYVPVDPIYAKF